MAGIIIILSFILFFWIISVTLNEDRKLNPVEQFLKDTVVTIQEFIYAPFNFVVDIYDDFKSVLAMYDEYSALKSNLDNYAFTVAKKEELESEIKHLQDLLDLNTVMTDYEVLNATVVFRDVNSWHNTITIDRGSYHGIKKDMAVISKEGVIGRVSKVNELTSEIKLLTALFDDNKTSALIQNEESDLNGILERYNSKSNEFTFRSVESQSEVKSGDLVVTSGYGDVFPRGLLIGRVKSVEIDQYGLSQVVHIEPAAKFTDIRYVTVIKSRKNAE